MRIRVSAIGVVIAVVGGTVAVAQERPFTPALTCSAIKQIVSKERNVVLATSENAYELVHLDTMSCGSDETGAPAFEPSSDNRSCLAGWRCKQRNNGDSTK